MPDDLEEAVDQIDPSEFAALKAELAATKLDGAMLRAGIDIDTPTGKMFRKAWDGEADVDAIKLAAAEIPGALKSVEAPAPEGTDEPREPGESGQFSERQSLTNEAPAGAEDPDPKAQTFEELGRAINGGARVEDAMGTAMRSLVHAANSGDDRVLAKRSN